jgi:hypothetical protein
MAETAVDPFADGANPFRATIDPFADGTIPFGRPVNTLGGRGHATIDMLQGALNRAGASGSAKPSSGTVSSGGRSSGQATIDLLQAGLDGKLPPVQGVNPFADLPPVPLAGVAAPNGVNGAVSFTEPSGPNPFSDLPPLALAPSKGAVIGKSDPGQQTLDLINSVRNAPAENQKPGGVPYQASPVSSVPDSGQQTLDLINSVRAGARRRRHPSRQKRSLPLVSEILATRS